MYQIQIQLVIVTLVTTALVLPTHQSNSQLSLVNGLLLVLIKKKAVQSVPINPKSLHLVACHVRQATTVAQLQCLLPLHAQLDTTVPLALLITLASHAQPAHTEPRLTSTKSPSVKLAPLESGAQELQIPHLQVTVLLAITALLHPLLQLQVVPLT